MSFNLVNSEIKFIYDYKSPVINDLEMKETKFKTVLNKQGLPKIE